MAAVHVGRRVAQLREAFGDSLREAAARTGVSHTTISRIEKGEVAGSFQHTLKKICDGYGVRVEFILGGRDPRQDFQQYVQRLSAEERGRLYFLTVRARVRMVIDFLLAEYPGEFHIDQIAAGLGFAQPESLWQTLSGASSELSRHRDYAMARDLARMTGVPESWFTAGLMEEAPESLRTEHISSFVSLMRKAAQNGIHPEVLDRAIDLLIHKQRTSHARSPT